MLFCFFLFLFIRRKRLPSSAFYRRDAKHMQTVPFPNVQRDKSLSRIKRVFLLLLRKVRFILTF